MFVVDDDDAVRDALSTALTSSGFAIAAFRSAAELIEGYRAGGPACLVVELDLPDIDALLPMLRKAGADLPVIVTTRRLRRRRLPDELAACVGLLEKPFGHDELMVLVRAALRLEAETQGR